MYDFLSSKRICNVKVVQEAVYRRSRSKFSTRVEAPFGDAFDTEASSPSVVLWLLHGWFEGLRRSRTFLFYVHSLTWAPLSFFPLQCFLFHHADQLNFPSTEFNYLLEALKTNTASDEKIKHVETNKNDQESEGLTLPDSPFASATATGTSAVI
ncbi:uncharacterized protein LOC111287883 [Durio zibethinus]|uniref:Uncharacterized protein LOC111287883 n=1 Tax=Durio zibethinus TaxID=66656 RepID=A0A6P5Y2R1_DURZI|nr:uncharacterized protein LOC111287883 [Durio zibethinus]